MVTDHNNIGVAGPGTRSRSPVRVNLALLRAFRRSPLEFLDLLVDSGASARPLRVGSERVLLLADPQQIWELLTAHARRTQKGRGLVRARLLLGDGLLTSEGDEHMRQRRALQAAFHPRRITDYLGCFAAAAQRAADRWSDGCQIDLVAEVSGLTLDGVGTALFGTDLRSSAPQVAQALADLLIGFRLAMAPGGVRLLRTPLPAARRVRRAKAELDDLVDDLVRRRNDKPAERPTVLDLLSDQPGFSDRQIRDQVMTLLLAGHETTAMALVWALAAIDQAPAIRAALEAEWDAWAKGHNDVPGGTSSGQLPGTLPAATLPLTTAVLAETLRLWPPSWMFSRRLTEPLNLGGRTVSAGTMCRAPDQPDRFDPKAPGQTRGAFLPFGAGPRMCIGEQFAWAEAAIVLAELGRSWRIHISPTPLSPGPSSMTLRPKDPVKATTSQRDVAFAWMDV
jgi:cytochrome P450